jgi:hypothetical protein
MRTWTLTMIAGAAIVLTLVPDPAAASWGWRRGWAWGSYHYPYRYYGSAYGYYGSPYRYYRYRYRYDCLGGRDSTGVPCR